MKKKIINLAANGLFLILCVCSIIIELCLLSDFNTYSLVCFYFWIPISVLLTVISIIRLIITAKLLKTDSKYQNKYISLKKIIKKTSIFLILFGVILSLVYSAYQIHNHKSINKECHQILNISNFTNCIEDENSDYNVKISSTDRLFGETDSTIIKMMFVNDSQHQIIVNGCHTQTSSSLLSNLRFLLMKNKLIKSTDYIKEENYIYYYEPGRYDGLIKYSKLIVIAKGDFGFVCAIVETSSPNIPIEIEKALTYCKEITS